MSEEIEMDHAESRAGQRPAGKTGGPRPRPGDGRVPPGTGIVPLRSANDDDSLVEGGELVVFEDVVERVEGTLHDASARARHWEQLRALRTELLLRQPHPDGADAIAVMSTAAGDGRSLLAADLAISFGQMGKRTLLVDADLRQPRLHGLFGAPRGPGLSDAVIRGESPMLHSVRALPCTYLLTAGTACDDPLDVLSGHSMHRLVEFWTRIFQVVVIDTPPSSRFPDPVVVGSWSNVRALLVTRAGHTAQRDVSDLLRRLSSLSAQVAGAVVNHH